MKLGYIISHIFLIAAISSSGQQYDDYPDYQDYADYGAEQDNLYQNYAERQETKT